MKERGSFLALAVLTLSTMNVLACGNILLF